MRSQIIPWFLLIFGLVLIIDELWMFGLPSVSILPDLSFLHVDPFHHWMLGAVLVIIALFLFMRTRRFVR